VASSGRGMRSRSGPGRQVQIENRVKWEPIETKITSINAGKIKVTEAAPGGLLGIATKLDPALTKSDALAGQVVGRVGKLPPVWDRMKFDVTLHGPGGRRGQRTGHRAAQA